MINFPAMKRLYIQGTFESPSVLIDKEAGTIEIVGKAIMESPEKYFKNLLKRTTIFINQPHPRTIINIKLTGLSTSSSKWLYFFLKRLEVFYKSKTLLYVNWYSHPDDINMQEAGEDYQELTGIPFHLMEV